MRNLHLNKLKEGIPGITKAIGAFLAEAAAFCFDAQGHKPGVILKITGDFEEEFSVFWTDKINKSVKKAWADKKEATEYAATAIALLLIRELTDFSVSKRLRQGERADYFLEKRNAENDSTTEAILEVSGIFEEKLSNTVNMRLGVKKANIDKIENRDKTAVIIVVAFNIPKAKISLYD